MYPGQAAWKFRSKVSHDSGQSEPPRMVVQVETNLGYFAFLKDFPLRSILCA
jgi:hypothetical protein